MDTSPHSGSDNTKCLIIMEGIYTRGPGLASPCMPGGPVQGAGLRAESPTAYSLSDLVEGLREGLLNTERQDGTV